MLVSHCPSGNRSAKSPFARLLRTILAALLVVPASLSAQRGPAGAPPREPMQELLPLRPTRILSFTTKVGRRGGSASAVTPMAQAGWFHDTQYPMKLVGADITHLIDAGGSAGVGSHGQQQGIGCHRELWNIGMGDGMKPMDALRVGPILGAQALGFGKDVGSLEVGKMADLVVFDRNPLETRERLNPASQR